MKAGNWTIRRTAAMCCAVCFALAMIRVSLAGAAADCESQGTFVQDIRDGDVLQALQAPLCSKP